MWCQGVNRTLNIDVFMNDRKLTFMLCVVLMFVGVCKSMGQNPDGESFCVTKQKSGHHVFSANINGKKQAKALLESGVHVLLIDSAFVFSNLDIFGLKIIPYEGKGRMNLGGRRFRITHKAAGKLNIGKSTSYQGEIFVLADYRRFYEMAVPTQKLYNNSDSSRIVKLDLKNQCLQMMSRKSWENRKDAFVEKQMNWDSYLGMPAVRTPLKFTDGNNTKTLNGNFNLDLGNASFVFLFHQNQTVQDFLTENPDLGLQTAYNKKGEVVAEAIAVKKTASCVICISKTVLYP